ncbi:hypothetical protein [Heyndrickxia acidicola]|uniref:Uncharacterized protein n=1 Tax=Heyndrickxia acidicola TaxID=209389 RepID=A0ABU6MEW2_9BACI|nr:hypothetical protein [Heyndrickxia acidicola]MED1203198.1 hypothetical protein [Heyndrickxia acidicola]
MNKKDDMPSLYYDEDGLSEITNQIQLAYQSGVLGEETGSFDLDKYRSSTIEK